MKNLFKNFFMLIAVGIMAADNKSVKVTAVKGKESGKRKPIVFCCLKMILSAFVSEIEGKSEGTKFYRSKGNVIWSNKVKPTNKNTTTQAVVRSGLRYYASTWQNLTQAQIQAWNQYGGNLLIKNKIGTAHGRSGINAFVAENQRLQLVSPGAAVLNTPPVSAAGLVPLNMANPSMSVSLPLTTTIDIPLIPVGQAMILYATPCLSAGKSFAKGKFRPIYTAPAGAAVPGFAFASYYNAVFGTPIAGKKVFFKWETISLAASKMDKFFGSVTESVIVAV